MPERALVRQSPAVLVLAQQVDERVDVQPCRRAGDAEHQTRAEQPPRYQHLNQWRILACFPAGDYYNSDSRAGKTTGPGRKAVGAQT